jgi:uncharacterized coiled-coil protein SlyX
MKKLLLFIAAASMISVACTSNNQEEAEEAQVPDLSEELQQATNFNDSLLLLMGDVYSGLDSINMQEQMLFAPGQGDNANRRVEIRNNLSALKARLAANRQLINELEKKVKNGNGQNAVLNKTIAQLKKHIESQEQRISELESQLANANEQITNLNTQVAETQEQLTNETAAKEEAQQEVVDTKNELNTVYYAIGTNKELKKQGLLDKKFLGSTKVLKDGFNASYFTKADKRNLSVIPTSGKKLKVWTNMPSGSYEIVDEANGTQSLHITNPAQFWSMTSYLVIQID